MIVVGPAVDHRPGDRLVLCVGKLQRVAGQRRRAARDRQHECARRRSGKILQMRAPQRADVIALLRWRPASSSGSRELTSRAKVQTSVTSVTFSGLPSITAPSLARVTETSCDRKRTVTCAVLPRCSAAVRSAPSIETKRVSTVSPLLLALLDRGLEAVIDLFAEQALELLAVARRIGGHDHVVGGAGAGQEVLGVEALVLARDGVETGRQRRARLGDALPAIDRLDRLGRLLRGVGRAARQRHDLVAGRRRPDGAGRGGIGIIGRPLAAGALAEHAAQAQENEHRQRQENDGVDIEHVSHAPEAAVLPKRSRRNQAIAGQSATRPGLFQRYNVGTRLQP